MKRETCAPRIKVTPPGPEARRIIARETKVVTPATARAYPLVIERGEGCLVHDPHGNVFLDFTTGIAVNALGHAHPEITRVVRQQAGKFLHMAGTDFYYETLTAFSEKLCAIAPMRGRKLCFLANSGTEAVEAAIKLARYTTGRPNLVAFTNAFHGRSMGSLSLTASKAVQRRGFAPLLPGVAHAPFGDLKFIEKNLFRKILPPEDVAAVFVEPIQGEGGYNVAPRWFLPGLRKLCDHHGILLVADEIQTGLGRTGRMWAVQHWGVEPDILCAAKPIGGGLPLGAIVAKAKLHTWTGGAHANTFGGNPLACVAGLRTIEIIEKGLVANAQRMGSYLAARLRALSRETKIIGHPRGLGLMLAVDVLGGPERRDRIVEAAFRKGLLLLGCGEMAIRFLPPLNVEKGCIDAAIEVLRRALRSS